MWALLFSVKYARRLTHVNVRARRRPTWRPMTGTSKRLGKDRRGSMAVFAVLFFAVAALITGGVVDFISLVLQKQEVQRAADAAALSAARELMLAADGAERVQQVAETFVAANYSREAKTTAVLVEKGSAVHVTVSSPPRVFFAGPVANNAGPMVAEAVAEVAGQVGNVCVVALMETGPRVLSLNSNARLAAPKCVIYSNSTDTKSVSALSNAVLDAEMICSAGGKEGSASNYSPPPLTDCPGLEDPLADRPPPAVGTCTFNKMNKKDWTGTLNPGVYCGGLTIDGNSRVTLAPGEYIIKDGLFKVDSNSEVEGEHVGFYFTGAAAGLDFLSNADVRLSAPKTGPMAGLLFFEDRAKPTGKIYRIKSNYVTYLVGTVYLPRGTFLVEADNEVAEESEFTVLVVRKLELNASPRLFLNTDYHLSDVPLPEGVGNSKRGEGVRLTK